MATRKVDVIDVVRWAGPGIQVPDGMPLDRAIAAMTRKLQEEEEPIDVQGLIPAAPMDGAIAFQRAIESEGGYAHQMKTGWPPKREQIQVVIDAQGTTVTVPWGQFEAPFYQGTLGCGVGYDSYSRICFLIHGRILGKYKPAFERLVEKTKQIVRERSIYRGRALHLDDMGSEVPSIRFLDVVKAVKPIYPAAIEDQVKHDFLSSITHPDLIQEMTGSGKRGILLAGPYGVGKTMLARWAARLCEEHGRTFALLTNPHHFTQAVDFLRPYFPAFLHVEDVEGIAGVDRTDAVNELLNKLDGVDTKQDDLVVCFTTNHLERINEAMRRPGRIDLTLSIPPPDATAAIRIAFSYARGNVAEGDDFTQAGRELAGMIPAVISEAVKRALMREAVATDGRSRILRAESLLQAARWIQAERTVGLPPAKGDPMDRFASAMVGKIVGALDQATPVEALS